MHVFTNPVTYVQFISSSFHDIEYDITQLYGMYLSWWIMLSTGDYITIIIVVNSSNDRYVYIAIHYNDNMSLDYSVGNSTNTALYNISVCIS